MREKRTGKQARILTLLGIIMGMAAGLAHGQDVSSTGRADEIWEKLPDTTTDGIDIECDLQAGTSRWLADDFDFENLGAVTGVTFWGSWDNDVKGTISSIYMTFHEDDGTGAPKEEGKWEFTIYPSAITETHYATVPGGEWFWDPYSGYLVASADEEIWRYDIAFPVDVGFIHRAALGPVDKYWIGIQVETDSSQLRFGWKTTQDHWGDSALYFDPGTKTWNPLAYPFDPASGDIGDAVDLSLRLESTNVSFSHFVQTIPVGTGGSMTFLGDGPDPAPATREYIVLGGASGMIPGTPLPGGKILPINWDWLTDLIVLNLNSYLFTNFLGTTNTMGRFTSTLNYPALPPSASGLNLYFAFTYYNPFDFVSNAVTIPIL